MTENELKLLWHTVNQHLDTNQKISKENTEAITRLKVNNLLSSMKPVKMFALVVGILWVIVVGGFVGRLFFLEYSTTSPFFLYSAAIQVLLTAIAIGVYIYQLDIINQVDFSDPIIAIQEKVAELKLSTLNVARILFLQLPFWTTFYWNDTMFKEGSLFLWLIQGVITLIFTGCSIWVFFNLKSKNVNKKWFHWFLSGKEWQPIVQSVSLLEQVNDFKKAKDNKIQ